MQNLIPFSEEFSVPFAAVYLEVTSAVILAGYFVVSSVIFSVVQLSDDSLKLNKYSPCRNLNMFSCGRCRDPVRSPARVECRILDNCRFPTI